MKTEPNKIRIVNKDLDPKTHPFVEAIYLRMIIQRLTDDDSVIIDSNLKCSGITECIINSLVRVGLCEPPYVEMVEIKHKNPRDKKKTMQKEYTLKKIYAARKDG